MIKMYCDICEKELSEDCKDVINIDFNSFGTAGFTLEIDKYKPKSKSSELNLCVECAEKVVSDIEDLRKIAKQEGR